VALVDFIRPEMKFAGLDQLKAQIAADGQAARSILAATRD
jgi:riboflavin kinase/FMN adenylyltransferase